MLSSFITEVLEMPYYQNYAAESGSVHNYAKHEDAISDVLIHNGFTRRVSSTTSFDPESLGNCEFVEQPNGTQKNPDFILKSSTGQILNIEAKSSTKSYPLYNSGGVEQNYLYIFCSRRYDETTIYKGSMIITVQQQQLIDQRIAEARARDAILYEELKALDTEHRGWKYYTRPMINQCGGATFTDYFTHINRESIETDTIEWVLSHE